MAANVGNMNVKLTLTAEQFSAALMAAGGDVNAFAMRVDAARTTITSIQPAAANAARGTRVLGSGMTALAGVSGQAAYGISDFVSQLGTRGLGGGLQAAANNIQMLGAAFGPWGLAASSAVAIATQGLGIYLEQTDRAAKKTKELGDVTGKLNAEMARLALNRASAQFSVDTARLQGESNRRIMLESELPTMTADQIAKQREQSLQRADSITAGREALTLQFENIVGPAFKRLFGDLATTKFLGVTGAGGVDQGQFAGMLQQFPQLKEALGKERLDELQRIQDSLRTSSEEMKQLMQDIGVLEKTFSERSRTEDAAETEAAKAKIEEEKQKKEEKERLDASRERQASMRSSGPAGGVGAFGADTASGFSAIQAAMRTASEVNRPQLSAIGTNTEKTADNTDRIAKGLGRIKAVTIA